MSRPRVLMACHLPWGSTFQVGSQQLARAFVAAGWDVCYVGNPVSPVQVLRRSPEVAERARAYRDGVVRDLDGHLTAIVPGALLTPHNTPMLRSPTLYRGWHRLTVPSIARQVRSLGFEGPDLLYIDSPIQGFWLDRAKPKASVMRIMDRMSGWPRYGATMNALEGEVARRVDLVAYSARTLEPYVAAMRPKEFLFLPNGVNLAHFADGSRELPPELAAIPRPTAVYVGAMADWFDWEAVERLAQARPGVSFVLIGPDATARQRLTARANLHLVGPVPYSRLPGFLWNADVGLIPFDVRGLPDLVNSIHPLKLYEYLACGLPVVATSWTELAALGSPARLATTPDELVAALDEALADDDVAPRAAFAAAADWSVRVATLLESLRLP